MKTLYEIIEQGKSGEMPTQEECYYAMIALSSINIFADQVMRKRYKPDTKDKDQLLYNLSYENHYKMRQIAMNKDPQEWLGKEHDPMTAECQKRRTQSLNIANAFARTKGCKDFDEYLKEGAKDV